MQIQNSQPIMANSDLIVLERGADELLLMDTWAVQPLYIKKGREYVLNLIRKAARPVTRQKLEASFPMDKNLIATFIQHRILVEEQRSRAVGNPKSFDGSAKTNSISLYLLLSQSCNLGCVYCLNGRRTYKTDGHLKMDDKVAFKSVLQCLDRLEQGGSLEIVFFGGEPLLNWPMVKKIILYCEKELKPVHGDKTIKYHLTSNLTVLPDDFLKWATEYKIGVLCDVDGEAQIHDQCRPYKNGKPSHAVIAANIAKLVDAGLNISLRATITSLNVKNMMEIALHHKAFNVKGSALVPLNPVNSDEDLLDEQLVPDAAILIQGLEAVYSSRIWSSEKLFPFSVYAHKIRPGMRVTMGCGAPRGNTPVVDVKGNVYPCIYLMGIQRFYLGNVMEKEWIDKTLLEQMHHALNVDHLDECKTCQWRYLCGGGCPVSRLTVLNNPDCTQKLKNYCSMISCDYNKKILELLLWELAQEADDGTQATFADSSVAMDATQTVYC